MKNIEKAFVPYDLSLRLKHLGFFENCLGYYVYEHLLTNEKESLKLTLNTNDCTNKTKGGIFFTSPLWQQAFDWFREKHQIHTTIETYYDKEFFPKFDQTSRPRKFDADVIRKILPECKTMEEARYEALKRLIEIIEETETKYIESC